MSINIQTIKNPKRKKRIAEFMDQRHDTVMDTYYEAIEKYKTNNELIVMMEALIAQDDKFFDPYIVIADVLDENDQYEKAKQIIETGFQKALSVIVDKEGNWPEHMEWGWLENRHIMRVIEQYADYLHRDENTEDALYLYRKLLRMNTNDNQGVRDKILAIRLGLKKDEWYQPFLVKKGPMAGGALKVLEVMEWFEKNARKFPDEFDWWFKEMKKNE